MSPNHERSTLALAIVTLALDEELSRKLRSYAPCFDEVQVLVTGENRIPAGLPPGFKVCFQPWERDFSKARNALFSFVQADWIFWIDDDDEITEETLDFLSKLKSLPLGRQPDGYALSYTYSHLDSSGLDFRVQRINLLKREAFVRWEYPVYERLKLRDGHRIAPALELGVTHRVTRRHLEESRKRNEELLGRYLSQHPGDPYMRFFRAEHLLAERSFDEAQAIYEYLLRETPPEEFLHLICSNLASIRYHSGNWEAAFPIAEYMAKNRLEMNTRDYFILASCHEKKGNPEAARLCALDALEAFGRSTGLPEGLNRKFGRLLPCKLLLKLSSRSGPAEVERYREMLAELIESTVCIS